MKRSNLILLVLAVMILVAVPKNALADSVSVSATVSAQISVEINTETRPKLANYTGVIVDCRGLGLRRAMSPVIKNESGDIIYGDKDLDFDKITEIGMVSYATTMDETSRAGTNPLIVQALVLSNFNSNPVLRNADADRVRITNEVSGYLRDLNVVFLTD